MTIKMLEALFAFLGVTYHGPELEDLKTAAIETGPPLAEEDAAGTANCNCVSIDNLRIVRTELDQDGDGIPGNWEAENGMDRLDPNDAAQDFDADGLTNAQEHLL